MWFSSFFLVLSAVSTTLALASSPALLTQDKDSQATDGYWYESIKHNGISPAISTGKNWTVFRNVKDYGAKGDGVMDDTAAIQKAINTGNSAGTRDAGSQFGATGQPAVVYFPGGTYVVKSTIRSATGTLIMGDPTNRAVIKAAAGFNGTYLLFGRDSRYSGLVGFFYGVKNLVLDTTAMSSTKAITLLEWSVSQNNILSNVAFKMPIGSTAHTGITTPGQCSGLIMNDLQFTGGNVGILLTATQYHLKHLYFSNVKTAVKLSSLVQGTGQGLLFANCGVGIDASAATVGLFNLIDSRATNTTTLLNASAMSSGSVQGSLVVENVYVDSSVGATVRVAGMPVLTGSVEPGAAWIRGNIYGADSLDSTSPKLSTGQKVPTSRPQALVNGTGFYHALVPPTYAEYNISQVVNVKDVAGFFVAGDGVTDDTANLQAIIKAATGKILYFPHGIYLLSDTLLIPTGSRMVGEAWSQFAATGAKFKDAKKLVPMIKVGNIGDVGTAQMSDFIFTTADILPGAVLVEVNMAGDKPGEVGFFNCHFRIGGARGGGKTQTACAKPQDCLAARLNLHLTTNSSSYWENTWSWTADHDLDGSSTVYPGTGGGFLIESTKGTWILGAGVEHHVLYQININNAKNVYIGLQEGETAYWQGTGNTLLTPAPWSESLLPSDPDWSWCAASAAQCRMGLYQRIAGSSDLNIYSTGSWNFVAGPSRTMCTTDCQDNAAIYEANSRMYVYGFSTINSKNLILERNIVMNATVAAVTRVSNPGPVQDGLFKTAIVAAYFRQSL